MHNEWELMVLAEDIEQGDTLVIESEIGQELMVLVSEDSKKAIILDDGTARCLFSPQTLEEYTQSQKTVKSGNRRRILHLSKKELSLRGVINE